MARKVVGKVDKSTIQNKKTVNSSIKKLKLLVTVVNRSKAIYYLDFLEQFEINMQTVIYGRGTADKELFSLLNIDENEKAILSIKDEIELLNNKQAEIEEERSNIQDKLDYITDDIDNDGIYKAMKYLKLI